MADVENNGRTFSFWARPAEPAIVIPMDCPQRQRVKPGRVMVPEVRPYGAAGHVTETLFHFDDPETAAAMVQVLPANTKAWSRMWDDHDAWFADAVSKILAGPSPAPEVPKESE